jgi:hypothetical protein
MSMPELCLKQTTSRPDYSPYTLAQQAIKDHHAKANVEAGLIRQLLVSRHVRHKDTGRVYLVTEIRMTLGWIASLYGRDRGARRTLRIGALSEVEIITPGEKS